jgi:hypothetical protein
MMNLMEKSVSIDEWALGQMIQFRERKRNRVKVPRGRAIENGNGRKYSC